MISPGQKSIFTSEVCARNRVIWSVLDKKWSLISSICSNLPFQDSLTLSSTVEGKVVL